MATFSKNAYVVGNTALQSSCSRNRNENERIIEFPGQNKALHFYQTNFKRMYRAKHVSLSTRLTGLFLHLLQQSESLYNLLTGSLEGKALTQASRGQVIGATLLYSVLAICALFVAV